MNEDAILNKLAGLPSPAGVVLAYTLSKHECMFVDRRLVQIVGRTIFLNCTTKLSDLSVFADAENATENLHLSATSEVHLGPETLAPFVFVPVYRQVLRSWADFSMLGVSPTSRGVGEVSNREAWMASVPKAVAQAYGPIDVAHTLRSDSDIDMDFQHTVLLGVLDEDGYAQLR